MSTDDELARVIPVIEGLADGARVPIDTMKLDVARAAVAAGATYVNDVTAFRHDPDLAGFVAEARLDCCLMHMLGKPGTMQPDPRYVDVVSEVNAFLYARMPRGDRRGRAGPDVLDPGIGFGKTMGHNLELLGALAELTELGRPLVIGTSRKTFLGRLTGRDVTERVHGTVRDVRDRARARTPRVFRVHDVAAVSDAPEGGGCYFREMADEPEDYDDDLDDEDDDEEGLEVGVTVEIVGLSLYTHHGVTAEERKIGQRLLLDVRFDAGEPDALITDRIEDTIDYGEVCPGHRLDRPAAVLPDAGAAVRGDRGPASASAVRRRERDRQGLQARAPDPAARGRGSVEVWREER